MQGAHDPVPVHYSESLQKLIGTMVSKDAVARPDMMEIISMPHLQDAIIETQMTVGRVNPR